MKLAELNDKDLAYLEGFIAKCASHGVDPETVLEKKAAPQQALRPALKGVGTAVKDVGRAALAKAEPVMKAVRPVMQQASRGFNAFTGQTVSDLRSADQSIRNYLRQFASANKPGAQARVDAMLQAQEKIKAQLAKAKADPVFQFSKTLRVPQAIEGLRSGIRSRPILSGMGTLGGGYALSKMLGSKEPSNQWYAGRYME